MLDTSEGAEQRALVILRSLLQEQREIARAAMLEMLDSRRYADVRRPLRSHAARPPRSSIGTGIAAGARACSRSDRESLPSGPQSRRPDSPRFTGDRVPPAQDPLQAPPLRAGVPGRPLPRRTRPLIKRHGRRPGRPRTAPGRVHRDRPPAAPRRLAAATASTPQRSSPWARSPSASGASAIELRARFPAAYRQLTGKPWQVFREQLESARPTPSPSRTKTALR